MTITYINTAADGGPPAPTLAQLCGLARLPRPPRVPRMRSTLKGAVLPPLLAAPLDVLVMDPYWIALGDGTEDEP